MNWWLIVVAVIMSIIILAMSIYLMIIFESEEDKNQAWLPKVVVVLGLSLACIVVLCLPFDVANRKDPTKMKDYGGGIDTALMWQILLWTVAVFVVVIIPFATFFYEAFDPEQYSFVQQFTPAFLYTLALLICFGVLTLLLWLTVGEAVIPYYSYSAAPQARDVEDAQLSYWQLKTSEKLNLKVSYFVYVVGVLVAIGWVFFFVYGGVGLTALPVDLITDFLQRPKPITAAEYSRETEMVAARAATLLTLGKQLQEKQRKKNNNSIRNKINQFKTEVYFLEEHFDRLEVSYKEQGGSPFKVFGLLLLGIISFLLTLLWILHIFLYNTINLTPFLNSFLTDLDNAFSLLGVLVYAIFSFYLLWASIKGCIKVGMRIVFFVIHPMKLGDTLMNAMLFNVGLMLFMSVVVTQFCAMSFKDYASNTAVDTLLNTYVRRLKGIGFVVTYMQYGFVFVCILSIFWLVLCPRKKMPEKKDKDDEDD